MMPTRLLRLVVPSTPRGAGLAILAAAIFLVLETVLVILLKRVDLWIPSVSCTPH
jgi:hypothetical protein